MRHPGFEGLLTGHTLLGRYHVEAVIGRGGFAAVYRATDERLGRTVAVKVITHTAGNPEVREEIQRRFQREARAIARLHHPNVVTVYDFGTDPELGLDFLVMELLQGEVLSERLRRPEPISVEDALRILLDAAAGVDAGHRAGMVHRDIKPGNIFLARAEPHAGFRVYVLDFGIARFTEPDATQLTHSGRALLSPAYAAPEQLRGDPQVTPAADVFSLGVIGYQMLAREKPFARDRFGDQADGAAAVVPLTERNPNVPPAVAEVIHRALSDDPEKRYPDAGAFARALRNAHAAPVPAPEPAAVPVAAPSAPVAPASELPASPTPVERSDAEEAPVPPVAGAVSASEPPAMAPPAERSVADDAAIPLVAGSAAVPLVSNAAESRDEAEDSADRLAGAGAVASESDAEPPHVLRDEPVPAAPTPATHGEQPSVRRDEPVIAAQMAEDTRRERHRPPADGVAVRTGGERRTSPALIAIPIVLLLALGAWFLAGRGGKGASGRVAENAPAATATNPRAPGTTDATDASPSPAATAGRPAPAAASASEPGALDSVLPVQPRPRSSSSAPAPPPVPLPAARPAPTRRPAPAPDNADAAQANRDGETLFERGDMRGAVERFRRAVSAAPGNAYYHNNLGWALFQVGDVDGAAGELATAVRLDPSRDIAYANIGEVERVRGNTAAAIAAYERFLQLNTDPRRAQIARDKLRALRGG
jgi:tRNA A-37 threonylcarbamoyl transferase component Bud32